MGGRAQMSRPKGSKNQTGGYFEKPYPEPIGKYESKQSVYIVVNGNVLDDVADKVAEKISGGYECQGGVSVTNYRADTGKIEFVYYQALVKK